jgi:hypothetical protein
METEVEAPRQRAISSGEPALAPELERKINKCLRLQTELAAHMLKGLKLVVKREASRA